MASIFIGPSASTKNLCERRFLLRDRLRSLPLPPSAVSGRIGNHSHLSKESNMRVLRSGLVGTALILCVGLSFGPARAQDFTLLQSPKFKAANASPILNAPYARAENIAFLILKARRSGAVSATCSATACKDDSDCGSGCECNDDSVCAPSDE